MLVVVVMNMGKECAKLLEFWVLGHWRIASSIVIPAVIAAHRNYGPAAH
jgi:hypothetical protein